MESILTAQRSVLANRRIENIEDASKKTADAVTSKSQGALNGNVIQLHKSLDAYNKTLEKSFKNLTKKFDKLSPETTRDVADAVGGRRQYKTVTSRLKGVGANIKDFVSVRGFLDKTGISKRGSGGLISEYLDRGEEKKKYINNRMKLDPYSNLVGKSNAKAKYGEQFDKQQVIQSKMTDVGKKLKEQKDLGFTKKQIERGEDFKKLTSLSGDMLKADSRLREIPDKKKKDKKDKDSNSSEKKEKADSNVVTEEENETIKRQERTNDLLENIVENTGGNGKKVKPKEDKKSGLLGGLGLAGILGMGTGKSKLLSGIFKGILGSIKKALMKIFSGKVLMGVLKKVFLPVAIIGSLFSGVMDAIAAFKETGSIGEAVIAFFGGILDFLTFGLVDAETLKNLGGLIDEKLIQPIKNIFSAVGDWIESKLSFLGINKRTDEEITEERDKATFYNKGDKGSKPKTMATFYNKGDKGSKPKTMSIPEIQVSPSIDTGEAIYEQSGRNDGAKTEQKSSSNTVVAPTTNNTVNQNTSNNYQQDIRNREHSLGKYNSTRYLHT